MKLSLVGVEIFTKSAKTFWAGIWHELQVLFTVREGLCSTETHAPLQLHAEMSFLQPSLRLRTFLLVVLLIRSGITGAVSPKYFDLIRRACPE